MVSASFSASRSVVGVVIRFTCATSTPPAIASCDTRHTSDDLP